MKNYNEIAESLFERREEYFKEQKAKKERNKRLVLSLSAVLAVAVIGAGVWKSGFLTSANTHKVENLEAKQKKTEILNEAGKTTLSEDEAYVSKKSEKKSTSLKGESYYDSVEDEKTTTVRAENKTQKRSSDTASTAGNEKTTAMTEKKTRKGSNDTASTESGDVISSFEGDASYGMPCYAMPNDGEYTLSYPVRWSVDKYGNTKKYRLSITITKNGNGVTDAEKNAELNRLKKAGCDIKKYTLWTYSGANADKLYYTQIGGVFTYEQIMTLFTGREYGYFFDFMSNGDSSPATVSDGSEFFEKTTKKGENYVSVYN